MRPIVFFHAAFLACAAAALLLPEPPAKGWAVLGLVVAYNVGLPLTARAVGRDDWVRLWAFLLPLSIFQILPDWVLAAEIGTLRFPQIGGPRIDDAITLAMGGMWVPPLFVVVATAREWAARDEDAARERRAAGASSSRRGRFAAARYSALPAPSGAALATWIALVVFLGTELLAPLLGLWEPVGELTELAGVALYVLPAEAALGWAAATAFSLTQTRERGEQIAAALAVSTFYTGALVLSHFLLDVAGWSVAT